MCCTCLQRWASWSQRKEATLWQTVEQLWGWRVPSQLWAWQHLQLAETGFPCACKCLSYLVSAAGDHLLQTPSYAGRCLLLFFTCRILLLSLACLCRLELPFQIWLFDYALLHQG